LLLAASVSQLYLLVQVHAFKSSILRMSAFVDALQTMLCDAGLLSVDECGDMIFRAVRM